MTTSIGSSIKLPSWAPGIRFALFLRPRLLGEVAALLAAAHPAMRPQALEKHFRGCSRRPRVFAIVHTQTPDVIQQSLDFRKLLVTFAGSRQFGKLQFAAQFEPLRDRLKIHFRESLAEHSAHRRANQFPRNGVRALQFAFVFQFQLAGDRRKRCVDVYNPCDTAFFAVTRGTLLGVADHAFQRSDWQPLAYSRSPIDALVFARLKRDLFHDFAQIFRHFHAPRRIAPDPRLLLCDSHTFRDARRIVRAY